EMFTLFPLAQRRQHAWIVLSRCENLIPGFEIHSHQKNLKRFRSVSSYGNLLAVAAKHFCESGSDRLRLRLKNLPHRVGCRIFLLPDIANECLGDDSRTW